MECIAPYMKEIVLGIFLALTALFGVVTWLQAEQIVQKGLGKNPPPKTRPPLYLNEAAAWGRWEGPPQKGRDERWGAR